MVKYMFRPRQTLASHSARWVLFVVLACALAFSACGKRKPAQEPESTPPPSTAEALSEEALLNPLPQGPTSLVVVDMREFWALTLEAMADISARGELRARIGLALDEWGQGTNILSHLGRPLNLSSISMAAWAGYGSQGYVLVMDAAAIPELEDGYGPTPARQDREVRIARRGDISLIGEGSAFDDALARADQKEWSSGLGAQARANEALIPGWHELSADTIDKPWLKVLASDEDGVAILRSFSNIFEYIGATEAGLRVGTKGHVIVRARGNEAALNHALSVAYAESFEELEGVVHDVPSALQGWTNWLNLVVRGVWARLELSLEEGVHSIKIAPVDCGSPVRNLWVVSALASAIDDAVLPTLVREANAAVAASAAAAEEAEALAAQAAPAGETASAEAEAVEEAAAESETEAEAEAEALDPPLRAHELRAYTGRYENVKLAFGSTCEALGGILPSLPVELSILGGELPSGGVLMLADYGALMRAALPSGFGILPFALTEESLAEAFGEGVLGLSSLRAQDAKMAVYLEASADNPQKMLFIRMPSGLAVLVPPDIRGALTASVGGMSQLASPVLEGRLVQPQRQGWRPYLQTTRADALLSVSVNQPMLDALSEVVEEFAEELASALSDVEFLSVVVASDFGLEFQLRVRASTRAEDFVRMYQPKISSWLREGGRSEQIEVLGGVVPMMVRTRLMEAAATQFRLEAQGERDVVLRFGTVGRGLGVGLVGLGFFAAMTPQKIHAEGGMLRGPLVPDVRIIDSVPR